MDILMQQAREPYQPLLRLTNATHEAYAARHGMVFVPYYGRYARADWTGHWDAIALLRVMLARGAGSLERVFWVDADALIVGDEDLREAMDGKAPIAMCRHPGPPEHWNCGVMFLRNCPAVRAWLSAIWARGPGVYPWYQQQIMNDLLEAEAWRRLAGRMDDRWNSTECLGGPEPCTIRAWHGWPGGPAAKLGAMRAYMAARGMVEWD